MKKRTVLITGASAGIGMALAHVYAQAGDTLLLTARRGQRLKQLCEELESKYQIQSSYFPADLADLQQTEALLNHIEENGIQIDILINNAGYGVTGLYLNNDWETHQSFLYVMVNSIGLLTHRLGLGMRERAYGRIINIASLAGHLPNPAGHTLYGPVKAWLIRFSEALAFELNPAGIHVTAVCPGFTYSEFHDVTGTREQVKKMPGYMWMTAEAVAQQAYQASERGEIVVINGRINRFLAWLGRHLPRKLTYWIVNARAGEFRKTD